MILPQFVDAHNCDYVNVRDFVANDSNLSVRVSYWLAQTFRQAEYK